MVSLEIAYRRPRKLSFTHPIVSLTGSSVLVDKDAPRVKRIKPDDGNTAEMDPFWPWDPREDGREIYAIRAFHQMHCIVWHHCHPPPPS